MILVTGAGLAWQVLIAPWMFPETICDFSSDISLSTSTLDFETYIQRSIVMKTVMPSSTRMGHMPQPPS